MRLTFLCGSFEFGADGVGDYTRRLAEELIKQGHQVSVIALYDKWVSEVSMSFEKTASIGLQVLRIPFNAKKQIRLLAAQKMINEFDPEILSLQFVIFSFNNKGLPFSLKNLLSILGIDRVWHIMFHEIWVGIDKGVKNKMFILGLLQTYIIKNLVLKLKPIVIHTQTKIYQYSLLQHGLKAKYLPLFSNIPVNISGNSNVNKKSSVNKKMVIRFVIFGSIHPEAPVDDFAYELAKFGNKYNIGITLTILGRSGEQQKIWTSTWNKNGLTVKLLGEQSEKSISKILSESTFGISTTPIQLSEKSGSIAAMLAHKLNVICVNKIWQPKIFTQLDIPDGIAEYNYGILESYLTKNLGSPTYNSVAQIANQFIESFNIKN